MTQLYQEDLAYVHASGFNHFAKRAGKEILTRINAEPEQSLIIDLGCGDGVIAQQLTQEGFNVLGIDISKDLIDLAKEKAPNAKFIIDSFYNVNLPKASCIISTSECFNYVAHHNEDDSNLKKLFKKTYDALENNGLFIFDILITHGEIASQNRSHIFDHDDWTMFVNVTEHVETNKLERDITLFRKTSALYRKSKETHIAQRLSKDQITKALQELGFKVDYFTTYHDLNLGPNHLGFICRKKI